MIKPKDTIRIKTKINKMDLFEFTMNNNYKSLMGVISVIFSLVCLISAVLFWGRFDSVMEKILIIFFALMFTVITPIEYYIRAGRQVNKAFTEELLYDIDEKGLTINIKEQSSTMPWDQAYKVVSTKNLVAVYSSMINAFILPKRDIGDNYDAIKEIMENNTKCRKFKM